MCAIITHHLKHSEFSYFLLITLWKSLNLLQNYIYSRNSFTKEWTCSRKNPEETNTTPKLLWYIILCVHLFLGSQSSSKVLKDSPQKCFHPCQHSMPIFIETTSGEVKGNEQKKENGTQKLQSSNAKRAIISAKSKRMRLTPTQAYLKARQPKIPWSLKPEPNPSAWQCKLGLFLYHKCYGDTPAVQIIKSLITWFSTTKTF